MDETSQVVTSTCDPAYAVDRWGTITAWNEAASQLFGYRRREVLGRACWEVLHGCDVYGNVYCSEHCPLREQAFRGEPVHSFVMFYRGAGGERIAARGRPVRLGPGSLLFLLSPAGPLDQVEPGSEVRTSGGYDTPLLSPRQREVLSLLAAGKTTGEIADRLAICESTTRNHIQAILARLKVHNRLQATVLARRIGLI